MKRHRHKTEDAGRKALASWESPPDAGAPQFCIATTFTFDATFFETECLGRFLQMDTHPQESDAVGYLIEREEKLASARVCVLVDRRHATSKESLRWDVLPVSVPGAVQHAKLAVLCWANHVRVIVGSGNLTEPAYRKNVEVFGSVDVSRTTGGAVDHVNAAIDFLEHVLRHAVGDESRQGPRQRVRESLNSLRAHVRDWPQQERRGLRVTPVFGGTGISVFDQLRAMWPTPASPARDAHVLSPFFDHNGDADAMIASLGSVMAKKRPRMVRFYAGAESLPDGRTRVFAPRPLIEAAGEFADCAVHVVTTEQDGEPRSTHAKMLVLANDDWQLVLTGSSNFTRAGFGIAGPANLEANLAYLVRDAEPEFRAMEQVWPEVGDDVDVDDDNILWDPVFDADDDGTAFPALPAGFREALFDAGSEPRLVLVFGNVLPERWSIRVGEGPPLLNSEVWRGQSGEHVVAWPGPPPFVLDVTWEAPDGSRAAGWPVNVIDPASLPPTDELRELTLEELIEVLGSTRPLHEAVLHVLRKRTRKPATDITLDPHKRVNTETFLLRRTKRVALALERLREKLERPVLTLDALNWRLRGPVGPMALAAAFQKEGRTPAEKRFFLAELALALSRVHVTLAARGGLSEELIRERIRSCILDIEAASSTSSIQDHAAIDRYIADAFSEAKR